MIEQEPASRNTMAKANNDFRNRCYSYSVTIIKLIKQLPHDRVHLAILNELLRAATNIAASVVEAKATRSKREYIRYYKRALNSANEAKYWLSLVRDTFDVDRRKINRLLRENSLIANTLASSLATLRVKKRTDKRTP